MTLAVLALAWAVVAPLFLLVQNFGENGDLERRLSALIVSQTPPPDSQTKRVLLDLVDEEGRRRAQAIDFAWVSSAVIIILAIAAMRPSASPGPEA